MAKLKQVIFRLSGRVGDDVVVDSKTFGPHLRKRPRPGCRKNEPALKRNFKRTKLLNDLAAGINAVMGVVCYGHKEGRFYNHLLKRFRAQPSNKKYLLLSALKGIDVNRRHTLENLHGYHHVCVKAEKDKIKVDLKIMSNCYEHPDYTNCYCYGVILLTWSNSDDVPKYQEQYTTWMPFNNGKPEVEFSCQKKSRDVHWALCLRQQLGLNEQRYSPAAEAMRIIEVGTYNKTEERLLTKQIG